MPNPHQRATDVSARMPTRAYSPHFFLFWIVGLQVQRWYKYVFDQYVGGRFCFGCGTFVWILSSRSRYN